VTELRSQVQLVFIEDHLVYHHPGVFYQIGDIFSEVNIKRKSAGRVTVNVIVDHLLLVFT
jgi:hypothetical protein